MTDEERRLIEISELRADINRQTESIRHQTDAIRQEGEMMRRTSSETSSEGYSPFFSTKQKIIIVASLAGFALLVRIICFVIAIIASS